MAKYPTIATLDSGALIMFEGGKESRFSNIEHYDLHETDLSPYICLIIGGSSDQEYLLKHKEIIANFLNEGKIIIFGGHLFRPWLPGGQDFIPREIKSHLDYHITILEEEPFFAGVNPLEMTYRKGVAGFFARGHHPMPEGATPLLALPDGEPTLYIDRVTTKGTLMVSSGATLFGFEHFNDSTQPITQRAINWIFEEYDAIQSRVREGVQHA